MPACLRPAGIMASVDPQNTAIWDALPSMRVPVLLVRAAGLGQGAVGAHKACAVLTGVERGECARLVGRHRPASARPARLA